MSDVKLSKKQMKAAELVWADELKDQEIAAEVGITDRTLYRWKNNADFKAYLDDIDTRERQAKRRAALRLATEAIDRLEELMGPSGKAYETQRKACIDILRMAGVDTDALADALSQSHIPPIQVIVSDDEDAPEA